MYISTQNACRGLHMYPPCLNTSISTRSSGPAECIQGGREGGPPGDLATEQHHHPGCVCLCVCVCMCVCWHDLSGPVQSVYLWGTICQCSCWHLALITVRWPNYKYRCCFCLFTLYWPGFYPFSTLLPFLSHILSFMFAIFFLPFLAAFVPGVLLNFMWCGQRGLSLAS